MLKQLQQFHRLAFVIRVTRPLPIKKFGDEFIQLVQLALHDAPRVAASGGHWCHHLRNDWKQFSTSSGRKFGNLLVQFVLRFKKRDVSGREQKETVASSKGDR